MSDAIDSSLPPVPRALTPAVRRRAWMEPTVRFWWLLALTVLVLAPVAGWGQISHRRLMSRLATQPTVQAVILQAGNEDLEGRPVARGVQVRVRIGEGDASYEAWGDLTGWQKKEQPNIGEKIDVKVDPQDKSRWAVVQPVPSFASSLTATLLTAALALAPLAGALLARRGVLEAWTSGQPRLAAKRERRQTALSPGSVAFRCNWVAAEQSADQAIFTVYVPKRTQAANGLDGSLTVLQGRLKRVASAWFEQT